MMNVKKRLSFAGMALAAVIGVAQTSSHALAESPEEFFRNKTLTLMHVTGPGGTMDLASLLVIKHMPKYLPEGANLVLEHRPGGGGIVGTNYAYNAAPKDGTYFFMPTPSMVLLTFARPDQALYDPMQLQPIGRVMDSPRVFVARADSGIETFEDLIEREATTSTMPPGSTAWTVAFATNQVTGTQLDIIPGYSGGGPMFTALEQGEVETTTAEHGNLLANKWHLVEDGTINVLAQTGGTPVPGLEDVPLWIDFVPENHELRGVAQALTSGSDMGLSLFLPPDVPQDRVDFLREAMDKTMNDPELLAEVEERNIPMPDYGDWAYVIDQVEQGMNQSETVKSWFEEAVSN